VVFRPWVLVCSGNPCSVRQGILLRVELVRVRGTLQTGKKPVQYWTFTRKEFINDLKKVTVRISPDAHPHSESSTEPVIFRLKKFKEFIASEFVDLHLGQAMTFTDRDNQKYMQLKLGSSIHV
jgi:hypothetical protein